MSIKVDIEFLHYDRQKKISLDHNREIYMNKMLLFSC